MEKWEYLQIVVIRDVDSGHWEQPGKFTIIKNGYEIDKFVDAPLDIDSKTDRLIEQYSNNGWEYQNYERVGDKHSYFFRRREE